MKANCAQSVFGGGIAKGADPGAVLGSLVNTALISSTSQYGSIVFAALPSYAAATESPTRHFLRKTTIQISINTITNPDLAYWNAGYTSINAITLLHELGHGFNDLFGAGSSSIVYDANPDGTPNIAAEQQNANTLLPCSNWVTGL
jgi:hypothetical protein